MGLSPSKQRENLKSSRGVRDLARASAAVLSWIQPTAPAALPPPLPPSKSSSLPPPPSNHVQLRVPPLLHLALRSSEASPPAPQPLVHPPLIVLPRHLPPARPRPAVVSFSPQQAMVLRAIPTPVSFFQRPAPSHAVSTRCQHFAAQKRLAIWCALRDIAHFSFLTPLRRTTSSGRDVASDTDRVTERAHLRACSFGWPVHRQSFVRSTTSGIVTAACGGRR